MKSGYKTINKLPLKCRDVGFCESKQHAARYWRKQKLPPSFYQTFVLSAEKKLVYLDPFTTPPYLNYTLWCITPMMSEKPQYVSCQDSKDLPK